MDPIYLVALATLIGTSIIAYLLYKAGLGRALATTAESIKHRTPHAAATGTSSPDGRVN